MAWTNNDGLYVTFGAEKASPSKGGQLGVCMAQKVAEIVISDLTDLGTTAEIIGTEDGSAGQGVMLPKGARIEKVEIIATTAATSGGSATLDIGLIRTDRSTAYDDDGLLAALPLASLATEGETTEETADGTYAGALVGTVLANNGLLVCSYNTAAFTAGAAKIRVYYV